jgi:hypothetical protein
MPRMRRWVLGAGAALALLALAGGGAAADPVNGTHKAQFPVDCAGQEYLVVGGVGAAAQVLDGTDVLIPAAFVQVGTWKDPATGEVVTQTDAFTVGNGNRTGQQGDLMDCTYHATFDDPDVGPVAVDGTVTAFLAPRG